MTQNIISIFIITSAAAVASAVLTYLALAYARWRNVIDHPNERSSHVRPTPRGGGVAIALTFLGGTFWLGRLGLIPEPLEYALLGGGFLVAGIGWIDDAWHAPAGARALMHVLAASWAVWWLNGFESVWLLSHLQLGLFGSALAVLGIVWWINLYNFMDGIDGIAAGQAVTVASFAGLLLLARGDHPLASLALLLAGAALGFLIWNWPPARIFMGDVGSGFLGFVFSVLAIASEKHGAVPLLFWIVLSGAFVFDATLTLIRRILWREPFWSAHRTHAYQRMLGIVRSHAPVTRSILAINLGLAALVYLALRSPIWAPLAVASAVVLLTVAYLWVERRAPMRRARAGPK